MRTLGVIGGLGPVATARLYQDVVARVVAATEGQYPHIVIDSTPLSTSIERALIATDSAPDELTAMRALLEGSVATLARAGVELVALPCNTLQLIGRGIVEARGLQFLDMAELSFKRLQALERRRVLLLGSLGMRAFGIYTRFEGRGTQFRLPEADDRARIAAHITELVRCPLDARRRAEIDRIVARYSAEVDSVLLACTDLSALGPTIGGLPAVDSLSVLTEACIAAVIAGAAHA